jgi:hypothetical protein
VAWTAIAVENMRVDGKPKQRHIAYLATICESEVSIGRACSFAAWVQAMRAITRRAG